MKVEFLRGIEFHKNYIEENIFTLFSFFLLSTSTHQWFLIHTVTCFMFKKHTIMACQHVYCHRCYCHHCCCGYCCCYCCYCVVAVDVFIHQKWQHWVCCTLKFILWIKLLSILICLFFCVLCTYAKQYTNFRITCYCGITNW